MTASDLGKAEFFVLRAKDKQLLLKMFDQSSAAKQTLERLKRDREQSGRSKMIRVFIKDQLTSGKTIIYAYRSSEYGRTWVKTKPHEAEHFRRNISPVSLNSQERFTYQELVQDAVAKSAHVNTCKPPRSSLIAKHSSL